MPFNVDAVTLTLLVLSTVLIIGILAFAGSVQIKARRRRRDVNAIRVVIVDYFRRSGVAVSVECADCEGNGLFTAMVESEPMKRFRLSHIIERTLREHVRKTCGLDLDRIYWRFPVKEAVQAAAAPSKIDKTEGPGVTSDEKKQPHDTSDEYINEGLENYRHIPQPEVTELPWETFEEMSITGREKREPPQ
jgi:hypothetical protein